MTRARLAPVFEDDARFVSPWSTHRSSIESEPDFSRFCSTNHKISSSAKDQALQTHTKHRAEKRTQDVHGIKAQNPLQKPIETLVDLQPVCVLSCFIFPRLIWPIHTDRRNGSQQKGLTKLKMKTRECRKPREDTNERRSQSR